MSTHPPELTALLNTVDANPNLATYMRAARQLPSLQSQLARIRISQLATFTIAPLTPFLELEAARWGLGAEVHVGPFNSIHQQLLDPRSDCIQHQPDIVFIAQLLEDVCPLLVHDYLSLSRDEVETFLDQTVNQLFSAVDEFHGRCSANVVIHNFPLPRNPLFGSYEALAQGTLTQAIRFFNERLRGEASKRSGVYILDFEQTCSVVGYQRWFDEKMWYLGRAPLSAAMLPALAAAQASFLHGTAGVQYKCLVLDLDNTLWGGVLGEEGLAGIKLGGRFPGNVYQDLQRAAVQLLRRGFLLAANSKNNEGEVRAVFRSHPDMVLQLEHFASFKINWKPKSENMKEIADELNIGVDSLVFLDDSPVECAMMRETLPQVLTLDGYDSKGMPDPLKMLRLVSAARPFQRFSLTDEDRRRSEIYGQQAARRQLQQSATSLEDFLESLDMAVAIDAVDGFTLPRAVELIHKTNQFNLTTRRHSAAQLEQFVRRSDCGVFSLRVVDRFGDNGIIGTAVVRLVGSKALLDTFVLSCRVIGRNIETAFLWHLIDWARKQGAEIVEGEFLPTAKNAPAADMFKRHQFRKEQDNGENGSRWTMRMDEWTFPWPAYIRNLDKESALT